MVIAKPHGYCSSACFLARTKCSHEKFPPGGLERGEEVTTPDQMSVKFIRLHVTVLIKVSVLNVGTHTHSICISHMCSATFGKGCSLFFPLKALKESTFLPELVKLITMYSFLGIQIIFKPLSLMRSL